MSSRWMGDDDFCKAGKLFSIRIKSLFKFCGVSISTRYSLSEYSGSILEERISSASSKPVIPAEDAFTVIFKGSLFKMSYPFSDKRFFSILTFFAQLSSSSEKLSDKYLFTRSSDCNIRYDGLVEEKTDSSVRAFLTNSDGAFFDI